MSNRKLRLVDCNPHWVIYHGKETDSPDGIYFECPEGHVGCKHVIPFTPALDGSVRAMEANRGWQRRGDTFDALVLSPSIRRIQRYADKAAALKDGCLEEHIEDSLFCAFHGFIGGSGGQSPGAIEFCGDSK